MADKIIIRDEKGVRKQSYRRFKEGKDYLPIQSGETRAMIEIMKQQFFDSGSPKGRKKYEDIREFKAVIIDYFDYIADSNDVGAKLIPDIEGFCTYAGICRDTLNDWERTRPGEFSDTIKIFKNCVAAFKKQLALNGKIPPIVFATDFNNNHGYTQRQELSVTPINPMGEGMSPEEIAKRIPKDIPVDVEYKEE